MPNDMSSIAIIFKGKPFKGFFHLEDVKELVIFSKWKADCRPLPSSPGRTPAASGFQAMLEMY